MSNILVGCLLVVGLATAEFNEQTERKWFRMGIDSTVDRIAWICKDYTRDLDGIAPFGFEEALTGVLSNLYDGVRTQLVKGYEMDEAKRYLVAYHYNWLTVVRNFRNKLDECKERVCISEDPECFQAYRKAARHAKDVYLSSQWRSDMWIFYTRDLKGDSDAYQEELDKAERSLVSRLDEIALEESKDRMNRAVAESIMAMAVRTDSIPVPPYHSEGGELGENDYSWNAHDGSTYVYTSITYEYDYSKYAPEGKVVLSMYSSRQPPGGPEQETRAYLLVPKRRWEKVMQKLHDDF